MEDLRKRVNEYLFHELGLDLEADESRVSETLFGRSGAAEVTAVGIPSSPGVLVGFPDASAWRRLAWAVGRSLRDPRT